MTARHRRHRHWSLAIAAIALALTTGALGTIRGTAVGHADAIATCTEAR